MGAKQELATIAKLQRAAAIGIELERIEGDVSLQRLTRTAWTALTVELAGGVDVDELRERIAVLPHLAGLVEREALRWRSDMQDRPTVSAFFAIGDGDFATAYVERLSAQLSVEQASAAAAARCAELYDVAGYWGSLGSFDEIAGMLEPLRQELEALDDQLGRDLLVRDVVWSGTTASLRAGNISSVLDADTAARPASALAQAARHASRGLAQAA